VKVEVSKILDDPATLEREAERFGRQICEKERQIRMMYETVLKSPDLAMIKPRLKYQVARIIRDIKKDENLRYTIIQLSNIIDKLVDEVRKRGSVGSEEFETARERLLNFLEAVVAYARYYKVKEKGYEGWLL